MEDTINKYQRSIALIICEAYESLTSIDDEEILKILEPCRELTDDEKSQICDIAIETLKEWEQDAEEFEDAKRIIDNPYSPLAI